MVRDGTVNFKAYKTLQPLKKVSIRLQVFEQMKNQILKGVWRPGTKIPSENKLTELFGVSRISVRQALQKMIGTHSVVHGESPHNEMAACVPHSENESMGNQHNC